ncbi:ribosomal protein S18-alanine N-acetyltransferase [Desulforegula conservatrix]|uniref:ribosomal protein S18-alanine N-acetyltransferase n=1 Tax=Desulforegula conservatrix TaxID=153026 RepID=UPI00040CCFEF|nr:ribosomal protein S18-alanine N-acetyltransferase [Desulforegula conservatrix]
MGKTRISEFDTKYIDQVMEIENSSFSVPWVEKGFTEELEIPGSFNFLALDESDNVAGYIVFRLLLDEIHLLKIAVKSDQRRLGTGMNLMEKLLKVSTSKNAYVIYLEVSAVNMPAISLYKTTGFVETGRRYKYYGEEDALNMELILGSRHAL